ncbi:MAG: ribosomal protein S18-alanine N-acetyltransferase [Ilumatobacteraceae bacterium]
MSVLERLLRRDSLGPSSISDVHLTPMRRRDLRHGVMAIEAVSYPRPWSQRVFESEIDQMRSGSRYYLVARRASLGAKPDRAVSGYAGLWFTGDEAHVTNVAVDPDEQRSGVATTLLLALADEAIRRGAIAWTLEVRVSSVGAQELYRRFGFVPAGVRTRYYENTEDAIVMWCNDIQEPEYATLLDTIRAGRDRGTSA